MYTPMFNVVGLRAIVRVEMKVETAEGKAKLGQNRSEADQLGVIAGLAAEPSIGVREIADAMEELRA